MRWVGWAGRVKCSRVGRSAVGTRARWSRCCARRHALVYFGLRNASKGLDILLDAVNLVVQQRPNTRLMLLGGEAGASDPTDRHTAHLLRQRLAPAASPTSRSGLARHVLQTGWLPPDQ